MSGHGTRASPQPLLARLPGPLMRAIDRLAVLCPLGAEEAAVAMAAALGPLDTSPWPEVAWRSSLLTGTGFPVELAWASRDAAIRWTCEVAGPEVPDSERLALCGVAAAHLTGVPVDLAPWAHTQRDRPLRWGGWLGVRQSGRDRRAKVYVELPPDPRIPQPWSEIADRLTRAVPGLVWRMAGTNADGSVELYARVAAPGPALLTDLAELVGDDGELVRLVGPVLATYHPVAEPGSLLPRPSGVSVVMDVDGLPLAVTWFSFAKVLSSSDTRTVQRLTRLCDEGLTFVAPGSVRLYSALAAGPDDGRRRHGMLGVGVDRAGNAWLQAGLRPT